MIVDIAEYIANNTSLVLGEDIWLHNLPEDNREGVVVRQIRETESFGNFVTTFVSVPVAYKNWTTQKDTLDIIKDLLKRWGNTNATWGISGNVEVTNFGIDEYGRYVSSILITVKH